jgi:hypothetical protein
LVLELYKPIREILRIPSSGLSRFGLHPQNVAFAILVLAGIYIGLTIRCGSIPRRRLGKLQRLIQATIESEMFADLVDEVPANFPRFSAGLLCFPEIAPRLSVRNLFHFAASLQLA